MIYARVQFCNLTALPLCKDVNAAINLISYFTCYDSISIAWSPKYLLDDQKKNMAALLEKR
jgi:hypothetical protein